MFYLDGISLSKLREELNRQLAGKKLSKISKNTDLSLSLHFGKRELVFSCDNAFPIVYVTDKKEEALSLSSGLTDTLRKCLTGGQLMAVEQRGFDRILIFSFSRLNELGEEKNYRIYFELIGKRSNFILTDEKGIILDLLRRYSLEENRSRTLFPGVPYEMPTPSGKISPAELTPGKFCALRRESPRPGCSFLTDCVEGVGKILAANVKNYEDFVRIRDGAAKPAAFYEGDAITLAAVLPVEPPDYTSRRSFESCQALINHYVENEKLSRGFVVLKRYLLTLTEKKIKKDRRILEILEKEKEEAGKQEQYKEWGDILAANLFRAEKGMQQLRARDFYHDRDVEIPLDPRLSPNENLDRLYKKYNKGKRTLKANRLRALEIGEDLEYMKSLLLFISDSASIENLRMIYEEIADQGLIREKENVFTKKNKGKGRRRTPVISCGELSWGSLTILYGRNNLENDCLTFRTAGKEDIWLHSKYVPGAHVVLRADPGKEITEAGILAGAKVAAWFTAANPGEKITVDYTKRKYVNKPKGGKPGFVTYTHEKALLVEKPSALPSEL